MKTVSRLFKKITVCLLASALAAALCLTSVSAAPSAYIHDPRLNEGAMQDIVADDTAVYGFRPNATGSLKAYAEADWSDPAVVESGRKERLTYHESLGVMYDILKEMDAKGSTVEEKARVLSAKRNEIRLAAYENDPEGLATVKARNLEKYGHEEGPLPDELYAQYGSWQTVINKAFSTNSGMDACLGLYDDYYFLYVAAGQVSETPAPAMNTPAAPADAATSPATGYGAGRAALTACAALSLILFLSAVILYRKKSGAF